MSHLFESEVLSSQDDNDEIDALNDETFGCDLTEDWEEEHDKLTAFIDTGPDIIRVVEEPPKIETGLVNNSSIKRYNISDEVEDLVKKSISNFIYDEDIYGNYGDIYNDFSQLETQTNNIKAEDNEKSDSHSVTLDSIRPPSPSILPFDDSFMSSVWRPLSPELISANANIVDTADMPTDSQRELVHSPTKQPQILTLEEIEREQTVMNGHNDSLSTITVPTLDIVSKSKVIRLEDLEAQLLNKNDFTSTTANTSASFTSSSSTSTLPSFMSTKMAPTMMEMAKMSLSRLVIDQQRPSPPTIIPPVNASTGSTIMPPPPPPGMLSKYPKTNSPQENNKPIVTKASFVGASQFENSANQKPPNLYQLQMANAMANALTNMSQLPQVRPQLHLMSHDMKLVPPMVPLDPILQQQQKIINKLITPAQAQRFYPSQMGQFGHGRNQDKYSGFMNQREKEWLIKIFRLQCKVGDPYVEDYYEINYKVKKAMIERRLAFAAKQQQQRQNGEQVETDDNEAQPLVVLPELARSAEEDKPKYIQFDNALGKIQVLNTKCPRKLLDCWPTGSVYKMNPYNSYLVKIEQLYENLLNIEDEDKRMPILPKHLIQLHNERRVQLCHQLFTGLSRLVEKPLKEEGTYFNLIQRNMPTLKRLDTELDPDIVNINKGLLLVYRSLFQLRDEQQLVVLISFFVKWSNFKKFVLEAEQRSNGISYGNMLVKVISDIKRTRSLVYITTAMDNFDVITHPQYGHRILAALFKQYEASKDKLLFVYFWKLFVNELIKHVSDNVELLKLCVGHLQYLTQL